MRKSEDVDVSLREYFKKKFNHEFTDEEMIEVHQSMFYLGRAIYNFTNRKKLQNKS